MVAAIEREQFLARFQKKREAGLVDIKFFVHQSDELTMDNFIAAANQIDGAVETGECARHQEFEENLDQQDIEVFLK